jgi:hypothetical protein
MMEERIHFAASDDPPGAEAEFSLKYPVLLSGYEYVELAYSLDEGDEIVIPFSVEEFKRLCKLFLRFDESLSESSRET